MATRGGVRVVLRAGAKAGDVIDGCRGLVVDCVIGFQKDRLFQVSARFPLETWVEDRTTPNGIPLKRGSTMGANMWNQPAEDPDRPCTQGQASRGEHRRRCHPTRPAVAAHGLDALCEGARHVHAVATDTSMARRWVPVRRG